MSRISIWSWMKSGKSKIFRYNGFRFAKVRVFISTPGTYKRKSNSPISSTTNQKISSTTNQILRCKMFNEYAERKREY